MAQPTGIEAGLRALVAEVVREELAKATPASSAPQLVTVAEYARRCSISQSTVRAAIREGKLAITRIGRSVRIAPAEKIYADDTDRSVAAATEHALRVLRRNR